MRGARIKSVQELLGHTSIEMTMRYAHLSPDVRRDAVKLLDVRETVRLTWRPPEACSCRLRCLRAGTTGSTARALAKGMAGDPLLQRARGGPERKALQSTTRSRRRRAHGTYAAQGTASSLFPRFFNANLSGAEGDRTPDLRTRDA
jgi:hypothetical protein